MAVPDTNTFTLQDVVDEVVPTTDNLVDCFSDAIAAEFDPRYAIAGQQSMLEFRNYGNDAQLVYKDSYNLGSAILGISGGVPNALTEFYTIRDTNIYVYAYTIGAIDGTITYDDAYALTGTQPRGIFALASDRIFVVCTDGSNSYLYTLERSSSSWFERDELILDQDFPDYVGHWVDVVAETDNDFVYCISDHSQTETTIDVVSFDANGDLTHEYENDLSYRIQSTTYVNGHLVVYLWTGSVYYLKTYSVDDGGVLSEEDSYTVSATYGDSFSIITDGVDQIFMNHNATTDYVTSFRISSSGDITFNDAIAYGGITTIVGYNSTKNVIISADSTNIHSLRRDANEDFVYEDSIARSSLTRAWCDNYYGFFIVATSTGSVWYLYSYEIT